MQVKFLPPWCKGEALPPSVKTDYQSGEAGMKGGHSEPDCESRRAKLSMDRIHELMSIRRHRITSLRWLLAWSKMGMVKQTQRRLCRGWTQHCAIQAAPQSNPAKSKVLNSTANEVSERGNEPPTLRGFPRSRCQPYVDGEKDRPRSKRPRESLGIGRRGRDDREDIRG